jgi:sugar phosphate isomerase/epimerase
MINAHRRGLTRRQFLAGAAAGAGLAAAGAGLAAAGRLTAAEQPAPKTPGWPMRLATSSIEFKTLPIEQAAERIAKLGFEAIDIWSAHTGCPHLDDVAKRLGPGGLKELLAKHSLKLYAFSVYAGGYQRYAKLLGDVGGGVAVQGCGGGGKGDDLNARMKAYMESLKPLAELAEKHDSYLAIENHGGSLLNSLDSFKAFVDNNPHKRVGIALAPYHIQAGKQSVEEAIRIAGKQLLFFYAWQNAPGTQQLPGLGQTDFTPWLAELAKIDYSRYVNPFMHGEPSPDEMAAALAKSREYLSACHAKAVKE